MQSERVAHEPDLLLESMSKVWHSENREVSEGCQMKAERAVVVVPSVFPGGRCPGRVHARIPARH